MLYHYTDRLSGADICREGLIRAHSMRLHKDMYGQDQGLVTPPLVWLTLNPVIEGTVVFKLINAGWKMRAGELWRIVLPADYAPLGLAEYSDQHHIEPSWWEWTVRTGELAASDYTTWRLHSADIPRIDWIKVEALAQWAKDGPTRWRTIESINAQGDPQ